MVTRERVSETTENVRPIKTDKGDVHVSRVDGYSMLYQYKKKVPFVTLKVELSDPALYATDIVNMLDHLKYLSAHSTHLASEEFIKID